MCEYSAPRANARAKNGASQFSSTWEMKPGTQTVGMPAPHSWYAMVTSPLFVYCVTGVSMPAHFLVYVGGKEDDPPTPRPNLDQSSGLASVYSPMTWPSTPSHSTRPRRLGGSSAL